MTKAKPLPGLLIAAEGCDGGGKTTQVGLLVTHLRAAGRLVTLTHWGGSEIVGPAISHGKRLRILQPRANSLLHAADFADRYERIIAPALARGEIVVCDRYLYTALARDTARGLEKAWVARLYTDARTPDLTLFIDTPPTVALARIVAGREHVGFYEAAMDLADAPTRAEGFLKFQSKVRSGYKRLAKAHHFVVLDGLQRPDELATAIWALVDPLVQRLAITEPSLVS